MALGKLGWTEYEYYCSTPEGFYYACQGYFAKLEDESLAIRNAATIIFRVMGGKENMDKIWPIKGREAVSDKFEKPTREWWNKMKDSQKKIDEQIKKERHGRS
jgi:hypothetical protein